MISEEAEEAVAILDRLLDALLDSVSGKVGRPGSDLRRAVGDLRTSGEERIRSGTLGTSLGTCFALARAAGATLLTMGRVRSGLIAERPQTVAAVALVQAAIRFALQQEAAIVARTELRSRQDVEGLVGRMNAAFQAAEENAADDKDARAYRAVVALHAAVTRCLVERSRPLPRIVSYAFPSGSPVLALANRIHADAARAPELILENKVVHPAFMPSAGRALSR
jgi:prophage DNA circulation protein